MNLQATDPHPWISAVAMDDKRVSKMTLETAQMYCTATGYGSYKPTHTTHPLIAYAANNISWLIRFHHALAGEHYFRTGHIHKSFEEIGQHMILCPDREPISFRNHARSPHMSRDRNGELTVPIDFTYVNDVHKAYRHYLRARWFMDTQPAKWTRRAPPEWLDEPPLSNWPLLLNRHDIIERNGVWRSTIKEGIPL